MHLWFGSVCNLFRLNSLPSNRYLIGKPSSQSRKASVSMVENVMLNSVTGASTHPFDSIYYRKWFRELSIILDPCKHMSSWNCRTIAINLAGKPNFAIIFQSPSRLTVSNALVRSKRNLADKFEMPKFAKGHNSVDICSSFKSLA